jgi:hypothetical protein
MSSWLYGLMTAKVFLEYFREMKRVPELARVSLLDSHIERLEEFISTEQASSPLSTAIDREPETHQTVTPRPESAVPSEKPIEMFSAYQASESTLWRYVKVGLRTVWRITKIVAVSALCLLIAAIILLQVDALSRVNKQVVPLPHALDTIFKRFL